MKQFLCDKGFLLNNSIGRELYHGFAADLPIYDYHCHLSPKDIALDRQFKNLADIWLEGDHFKWRAMRTVGVKEHNITGESSDFEKFQAWAKTVPHTMGNPLYHWSHLELRSPFGITDTLIGPDSADSIWEQCNDLLKTPEFTARGIMKQMNVEMVGTTDDPIDSLEYHRLIANDQTFDITVLPSWRPDKVFKIELEAFANYIQALSLAAETEIIDYQSLLAALDLRLSHFDAHGCCIADHGIEVVRYAEIPEDYVLDDILSRRLQGQSLLDIEIAQFTTAILVWLGRRYSQLNWVMQMHIGAQRNNSSRMFKLLGVDSGYDSIGDQTYSFELAGLLNEMDKTDELPKTILYCINPRDNEMLASMVGNFQGGGVVSKIQFGSGWWFNDQKNGIEKQLETLSQIGLLSQFVGMLTDSRSFLSFTRHEYFRRILCNMVGEWVERGELPYDLSILAPMIKNICYYNAKRYFG